MKKIIAVVITILVIAGVSAPFVNGLVMEKIVKRTQKDLNEMYEKVGYGFSVEIINYDRGFSSSEIEWKINLGNFSAFYGIDEIVFVEKAEHGYTGVVSETSLEKNQWFVDFLNDKLDGKNPLSITTNYSLMGKIETITEIEAFSLEVENETLDIRPAKSVAKWNNGLTHFVVNANWEGLSAADKINMAGVSLSSDMERVSTLFWEGEINFDIANIDVHDQGENFELVNLTNEYVYDFDDENNKLSLGATVKIESLVAEEEKIEDISATFGFNNLDAKGYEEFIKVYTRMVSSVMGNIPATEEDPEKAAKARMERMQALSGQIMAAYEKLLKKGLEFKISDLHVQLPEGEINGNAQVRLNRDVTFAEFAAIQPNQAFEILFLKSDLTIPAQLAGNNTRFVEPLFPGMQTGLFVKNGENLVHNAQTENGKMILNGHEVVFN